MLASLGCVTLERKQKENAPLGCVLTNKRKKK
jgi:hypothetical protein